MHYLSCINWIRAPTGYWPTVAENGCRRGSLCIRQQFEVDCRIVLTFLFGGNRIWGKQRNEVRMKLVLTAVIIAIALGAGYLLVEIVT